MTKAANTFTAVNLSHDDVVRVCGEMLDWKAKAIVDSGATLSELEVARAWASGQDEVLGEEREALSGVAAEVYDILFADEEPDEGL